jgi:hypothetical protein
MMPPAVTVAAFLAAIAAAGCSMPPPAPSAPASPRFTLMSDPPALSVATSADLSDTVGVATRLAAVNPAGPSARPIAAEFLPLLHAAPEGRTFAGLPEPRALVQGEPAALCPALSAAGGSGIEGAVAAAVADCRDRLARSSAPPDCGCRLLAVNSVLAAPLADFAYATGLPARLIRDGRLDPLILVAEERLTEAGEAETLIRAGSVPVWLVRYRAPDRAELVPLAADGSAAGPARPAGRRLLGLDRGRFRERLTLPGEGLTILIGF